VLALTRHKRPEKTFWHGCKTMMRICLGDRRAVKKPASWGGDQTGREISRAGWLDFFWTAPSPRWPYQVRSDPGEGRIEGGVGRHVEIGELGPDAQDEHKTLGPLTARLFAAVNSRAKHPKGGSVPGSRRCALRPM
jgi:hypothetical protein